MKTDASIKNRWEIRTITVAGLLGATSIVLGVTPLGFIPVPSAAGHATIMHVPAILGGILEGPRVGALTGFIFGLHSLLRASNPLFADPLVAILPRIFIGIVAYWLHRWTKSAGIAATFGTVANTAGVLGMAVVRGYITGPVAWGIAISQGVPEIVVAVIFTVLISRALAKIRR